MTSTLDEMLKEKGIDMPYFEAPVKECLESELVQNFFSNLDDLLNVPGDYRYIVSKDNCRNKDDNEQ